MKTTFTLFAAIILSFAAITKTNAQYTLSDDDVVVTDGIIESCSYDFSATEITIPGILDGQTIIGIADKDYSNGIFKNKGITSINLPNSIEFIGNYAFYNNDLTDIKLPSSLIRIGGYAFKYNSLSSIDIPNTVTEIGSSAFYSNSFSTYTLPTPSGEFAYWTDEDGNSYNGGEVVSNSYTTYNAQYEHTLTDDDVVVTNGIIESCSYDYSAKIIIIPSILDGQTVTGIADNKSWDSSGGIFNDKGLTSVTLPNTIQYIGTYAFGKNNIFNLFIPASVTTIGQSAFSSNQINKLDFESGSNLTSIGYMAFNLNNLDSIFIPKSVSEITMSAFSLNYSLDTLVFEDGTALEVIPDNAFSSYEEINFVLPTAEKEGYLFKGWKGEDGTVYNSGDEVLNFSSSFTAQFEEITNGIYSEKVSLSTYPNPTTGIITIEADGVQGSIAKIIDISGNQLISKNLINNKSSIDLSSLNTGIYYIIIEVDGDIVAREKVVKK